MLPAKGNSSTNYSFTYHKHTTVSYKTQAFSSWCFGNFTKVSGDFCQGQRTVASQVSCPSTIATSLRTLQENIDNLATEPGWVSNSPEYIGKFPRPPQNSFYYHSRLKLVNDGKNNNNLHHEFRICNVPGGFFSGAFSQNESLTCMPSIL